MTIAMEDQDYSGYGKHYNKNDFFEKVARVARKAGIKVIYAALLLYYVLVAKTTSKGDRAKILGALGYFILPIDLIPDGIPIAGYTDDLAALMWGIYSVAKNITPEIKEKAHAKLNDWFGDYDEKDIAGLI
jgi:uncharacterized membrane protein YkvA (DUF1232 family)